MRHHGDGPGPASRPRVDDRGLAAQAYRKGIAANFDVIERTASATLSRLTLREIDIKLLSAVFGD
jgi:hypothetical protein